MNRSFFRSIVKRATCAALAAFIVVPAANAGTYSIVDLEWTVSAGTGTNGGYIHFGTGSGENPLDMYYGIVASISAPTFTESGGGPPVGHASSTSNPIVMGLFRWKIQWVGAVGEAAPVTAGCNAEYKGASNIDSYALDEGSAASAQTQLSDPFYSCVAWAASTSGGVPDNVTALGLYNGVNNLALGSSTFTYVSGTTWTAYVNDDVNDQASMTANGALGPMGFGVAGSATSSVNMNVIIRLTTIGGQQVQTPL